MPFGRFTGHIKVKDSRMGTTTTLEQLKQDAFSGALGKASAATLGEYAAALCHSQAFSLFGVHEFPQISETVRIHLLRAHIESLQSHVVELHDHITTLNKSNAKIQHWVIALSVAAVIGTAVQTMTAILPYVGILPTAQAPTPNKSLQQALPSLASVPTISATPSSRPASSLALPAPSIPRKP
jgi:hypothetical protein